MTEFTERYKNLSNYELLEILTNSQTFQSLAVETAKKEIESRNLSEAEINKAKLEIECKQQEKQKTAKKRKQKEDNIKETAFTFFDTIAPIQNGIQTPEKIIRLTTLIFGGISIYRIFKEFGMLHYLLTDSTGKWDLSMIEYFFPLIILPLATVLFWKRKKIGWILLSIFLTYSAVNAIGLFLMNLGRQTSEITVFDSIIPTASPITHLITLLFFGATLWLICKANVRDIFQITKKTMLQIIGFTILINAVFIYSIIG